MVGLPWQQRELGALVALRTAKLPYREEMRPRTYELGRLAAWPPVSDPGRRRDRTVLVKTPRTESSQAGHPTPSIWTGTTHRAGPKPQARLSDAVAQAWATPRQPHNQWASSSSTATTTTHAWTLMQSRRD